MAKKTNGKKSGKPMGRPSVFTEAVVKKLEEAFALDATVSEACFYANISREIYYLHVKEGSDLFNRFEALRERPVLLARQAIVKGFERNPELALKYVKNKRNKEFSERNETEVSGNLTIGELLDQAEGKKGK